jgi:L-threonylcarbamoyladenylate synthase
MARIYDCSVHADLLTGTRLARAALGRGELVVVPTDTVCGVAADAFNPAAVARLLEAKGRTRATPAAVLVPDVSALTALAACVPQAVSDLVAALWPGGLTIILPAQPSLAWDLGDARGTVAIRMPNHSIALELLAETGPLAVSSANRTGNPPALSAHAAESELGDSVSVYLDEGNSDPTATRAGHGVGKASTIIDATALADGEGGLRIVRHGVVSDQRIREIVGDVLETAGA